MKLNLLYSGLILFLLSLTSCEVVEGIFKVGFWAGIIVVVLIIVIIIWLVKKFMS